MSETAPVINHEAFKIPKGPEVKALPTAEQAEALRPGEADPLQRAEQARSVVEAIPTDSGAAERVTAASSAPVDDTPTYVDKNLRNTTLGRELKHIRSKLNPADKALSKVIHNSAVRGVSEASGKSLARPSGLLGGGLVGFLGTTGYLLFSRHIGLEYNYFIFLLFFAGGFVIGLVLELVVWSFTRKSRV